LINVTIKFRTFEYVPKFLPHENTYFGFALVLKLMKKRSVLAALGKEEVCACVVNVNPAPKGLSHWVVGMLPKTCKGKLVEALCAYNIFPLKQVIPANIANVWVKKIEEAR
jgi:hypothetical protein